MPKKDDPYDRRLEYLAWLEKTHRHGVHAVEKRGLDSRSVIVVIFGLHEDETLRISIHYCCPQYCE